VKKVHLLFRPVLGSALDAFDYIKGYVGIGYVCGVLASFIFG